jgi:hypothetical protein
VDMEPRASGAYGVRMGHECVCHIHEVMVPMERHHVWPLGDGGPNIESNLITVCCNAHYSIHAFLDMLWRNNGIVPWTTARQYGKRVRDYAYSGYRQAIAAGVDRS